MEEQTLKTDVYINENIFCETAECPVDVDFTLPDYCPDITKVFKCRASARVASKTMNGKSLTAEGAVCLTLLYADENGNLCSYEYPYPFSKTVQMPEDAPGSASFSCRAKTDYVNCRAVTNRKVDIHGAVSLSMRVFRRKCTSVLSDLDDDNLEQRQGVAPATIPMGYSEKYLMVEEEIPIGQGQPAIGRVLRCDANPYVRESKIINDKILVKGDLLVSVLYCADTPGMPQTVKTVLPFSQIMDMEGVTEACECDTHCDLSFLEIRPKTNDGTGKTFTFTAKLYLSSEAYCSHDVAVLFDAYSRKYETEIKREQIGFEKIIDHRNETYHCKKNIELEEPVTAILECWCDMQSSTAHFGKDGMTIDGVITVCLIALQEDSHTVYREKTIDFDYRIALELPEGELSCTPQMDILSCGYTLTGSNHLELRVDLGINAAVYCRRVVNVITELTVDSDCPKSFINTCAMTIYFPGAEESVWEVAKQYNASTKEIRRINDLESDLLPEGKMLLIPSA